MPGDEFSNLLASVSSRLVVDPEASLTQAACSTKSRSHASTARSSLEGGPGGLDDYVYLKN